MIDWIDDHQGILWLAGAASVVIFVASLLIVPAMVVRIPADYFMHDERPRGRWANRHSVARAAISVSKNLLGTVLILAGIAMLLLPGQGVLTLVVGFLLLDLPGKYQLEKRLIARGLLRPINWLRHRAGSPPLQVSWPPSCPIDAASQAAMRSPPARAAADRGWWR